MDFDVIGFGDARDPKQTSLEPEKALMLAVFEQAVHDLDDRNAVVREDAKNWLDTDRDLGLFSFISVCQHFRLNPEATRKALRQFYSYEEPRKKVRRIQPQEEVPEFTTIAESLDFESDELDFDELENIAEAI